MAQNQTLTIAALIFLVGVAGLASGEAAADDERRMPWMDWIRPILENRVILLVTIA